MFLERLLLNDPTLNLKALILIELLLLKVQVDHFIDQIEADLEIFVDEEEETIILFNHDRTEVLDLDKKTKAIIPKGIYSNGFYQVPIVSNVSSAIRSPALSQKFPQAMMISTPTRAASSSSPLQSSFTKWHNRLGHPSIKKLRSLTSKLPLSNKELFSNKEQSSICPNCSQKFHRSKVPKQLNGLTKQMNRGEKAQQA
ncbi:hypothetical protein U1Q18_037228 [Sarracenia purpurea var. burkii]